MSPRAEDFERLALRWADSPHPSEGYLDMVSAMAAFPERYMQDRDGLPQLDCDRAFGLMSRACDIIDGQLFFAEGEEQANTLMNKAMGYLDEALKLDPHCYDALRIRHCVEKGTRDVMVDLLAGRSDEVRQYCLDAANQAQMLAPDGHWSLSVFQRPYLRWLLHLANEQLNCGRYTRSLEACWELLNLDQADVVGARFVAAYDYVKLEDPEGLAELIGRFPDDHNAWFRLARCFMAYKQRRLDDAAAILHEIARAYPGAGTTLFYQEEIALGLYGHLQYQPETADELYIAVSEAAVILDENCGDGLSPLSDWIANDPVVQQLKEREERAEEARQAALAARDMAELGGSRMTARVASARHATEAGGASSEAGERDASTNEQIEVEGEPAPAEEQTSDLGEGTSPQAGTGTVGETDDEGVER